MDEINQIWSQWQIVGMIGEGSYGKVYQVKREDMGAASYAAVKVMHIPQSDSEIRDLENSGMDAASIHTYFSDVVQDLMNEIRIMESLKSANNIVSIEDFQVMERQDRIGWDIYIRMELLTGLGSWIRANPLTQQGVVKLGMDICMALMACEQVHIIHRDIKVDNVFVNQFGAFKLGDFGISKQLERTQSALSQKGTNMYMAPEVFKGDPYDSTVDIYSLGIMMYRLLNQGRFPFMPRDGQIRYEDQQNAMVRRISGEAVPPIEGIDPLLSALIIKACAYDHADRYQSASTFYQALGEYQRERQAGGQSAYMNMHTTAELPKEGGASAGTYGTSAGTSGAYAGSYGTGTGTQRAYAGDSGTSAGTSGAYAGNYGTGTAPQKETAGFLQRILDLWYERRGLVLGCAAGGLFLIIAASFLIIRPWKKSSGTEKDDTVMDKYGISARFPSDWKVTAAIDEMWAETGEGKEKIQIRIRPLYAVHDLLETMGGADSLGEAYTKGGMDETSARYFCDFLNSSGSTWMTSKLCNINKRNYYWYYQKTNGLYSDAFMTMIDTQIFQFSCASYTELSEQTRTLMNEVMKSVKFDTKGIDYSELQPADAAEIAFAMEEDAEHFSSVALSMSPLKNTEITEADQSMTISYAGTSQNSSYELKITKTPLEDGMISSGMNEATMHVLLKREEQELGRAVKKNEILDIGKKKYLYINDYDADQDHRIFITDHKGYQYRFDMVFDSHGYWSEGEKMGLKDLIGTVGYDE